MRRAWWSSGALATVLLAAGLCLPGTASGQEGALDRVAALTEEGRTDEARSTLLEWWESEWEESPDAERQRGLWLRAVLTVDPTTARRDYTRLVLEHPGGPHSGSALLRLAQAADVDGRTIEAARRFEQLLREYPDSPERLVARQWLDENQEAVARAQAQPTASSAGENQGSGSEPEGDAAGETREREAAGPATVQLGAFSSEERARLLLRRAQDEGIVDLRVVRVEGSGLVRVRAGRFPTREAASELRSRVRERGFEATIVTDAERESPIP